MHELCSNIIMVIIVQTQVKVRAVLFSFRKQTSKQCWLLQVWELHVGSERLIVFWSTFWLTSLARHTRLSVGACLLDKLVVWGAQKINRGRTIKSSKQKVEWTEKVRHSAASNGASFLRSRRAGERRGGEGREIGEMAID